MKSVKVNQENCIGCGMCEGVCPEVFQLTDDFLSSVIAKETELEAYKDKIVKAKEACPTGAIEIEE